MGRRWTAARMRSMVTAAAALATLALVLYRVFPARVPHDGHPGFVDTIFASTVVVFGARVLLLALALMLVVAAFFIVVSIRQRAEAGQWVRTFGPFETGGLQESSDVVRTLGSSFGVYEKQIALLRAEVATLAASNADLLERLGGVRDESAGR